MEPRGASRAELQEARLAGWQVEPPEASRAGASRAEASGAGAVKAICGPAGEKVPFTPA